jgi:ParB family transcriptional regulator, chromosome partitioning protein
MSVKDEMAAMTAGLNKAPTVATKRASSTLTAPGALMAMNGGFRELQATNERLKAEREQAVRVRLDLCDDGDLHVAPVDPARVAELKENLKANGQTSPAVLRRKEGGRYEIAMGRHRKAALLELGETEWDAVVKEMDDDQAERLSFYDNLFAPNISDFVIYCGLKRRKERKGYSNAELALESGLSKSRVTGLLCFSKLSPASLAVISGAPKLFGFNMVQHLAGMVESHPAEVERVIEMVARQELTQDKAPRMVLELASSEKKVVARKTAQHSEVPVVWQGREFARVDVRSKKLTITLTDKSDIEAVQKAVLKVLEERAKKSHPESKP